MEFKAHGGARVASWSNEDLNSIFELRAGLEGFGARQAAARIEEEQLEELRDLAQRMEAAVADGSPERLDELAVLNIQFHRLILEAGGSERLADLQRTLVQLPLVHRTFHQYSHVERARSMAHHREIIDALASGDGLWAEASMRCHVLSARHVARRASGPDEMDEDN